MGIFSKDRTYRIYRFLFLALALVIPVHDRLAPPIISLIGILWILELNFRAKYQRIRSLPGSGYLLSFMLIYIFYMIGTLYSDNLYGKLGAFFNLGAKMSLWVFPLLFATIEIERFGPSFKNKIKYSFLVGCLISIILIFNKAVFNYFQSGSTEEFYYIRLAHPQHPSYLALFFTFAVAILLTWMLDHFSTAKGKRNLAIVLVLLFHLFIVLLSSKAGILALAGVYLIAILFNAFFREKRTVVRLVVPAVLLVLFLVNLSFFPRTYSRFYTAESVLEEGADTSSHESSVSRILVWRSSLEVIGEHPVIGVGTGDVEDELRKVYSENDFRYALDDSLNAHNQYLQTFIALGIFGFLALVAGIFLPAWFAFWRKHLLYLLFLMMFAFHLLVESMLERQAGVVFYAFMNSFLFYFSFLKHAGSDPERTKI